MKAVRYFAIPLSAVAALLPAVVYATNGMNLEGYGPVATGMGGASMAYDNGSAAVMNNPATIGLMPDGHRADVALGMLGPDVSAKMPGMPDAKSSATAFYMPALGWLSKQGDLAYGVGVFSQGGMGTEYKADSFMAAGSGEKVRSEVGVGRIIFPISYAASKSVQIGGSIDYVWAGMDLKMAMSGDQFYDLASTQQGGKASGSLLTAFDPFLVPNGGPVDINNARFDFSDSSAFTGEAKGSGFGAKIGAVFNISPELDIGVVYHTKTSLSDLKSSNAKVTMDLDLTGMGPGQPESFKVPLTGEVKVKDFQWPAFFGIGASFKPMEALMIAADVKIIQWADAMKSFKMNVTFDDASANNLTSFGIDARGKDINAELFQNWDDQTVIALGGSYKVDPAWTVRLGYNHASNPIPDSYLNALFPAIEETHITAGVGYVISTAASVDFSLAMGLEAKATNPGSPAAGDEVTSTMSQLNWQFMYSYRY